MEIKGEVKATERRKRVSKVSEEHTHDIRLTDQHRDYGSEKTRVRLASRLRIQHPRHGSYIVSSASQDERGLRIRQMSSRTQTLIPPLAMVGFESASERDACALCRGMESMRLIGSLDIFAVVTKLHLCPRDVGTNATINCSRCAHVLQPKSFRIVFSLIP